MTKFNAARERTDAKLRYAAVHLNELKTWQVLIPEQGVDWDKAHQESFLFHLLGVRDALLQEINLFYGCALPMRRVTIANLRTRLEETECQSKAFRTLVKLEGMKSSWISTARRLRNLSMHQKNVPRVYHVGGENHNKMFFRNPLTNEPIEVDYVDLFQQWLAKAGELVENLRSKMPGAEDA